MDLKERVPFGRTGLMVSRIGLASGYGVPTAAQMEDNLKALDAGPLDEEEMARVRRIGKHICGKK